MTKQIAEALSLRHHMISCTADMMRHDLFGFIDAGGNYHTTALRKAWEQGGLFVVDEVDLASANLMGGLNDVANVDAIRLEFPDESVLRHPDFRLVACANTIGEGATSTYRGRNALDGAFLDRFVFISVELDEAIETRRVMALMSDQTQAVSWLGIVRQVRRNIKQYALPTIITPRAAMHGAQLLELGNSVTFTVTSCITRGCSDDVARKLLDGVEVMP
jgi:cobaltochelatase CobS